MRYTPGILWVYSEAGDKLSTEESAGKKHGLASAASGGSQLHLLPANGESHTRTPKMSCRSEPCRSYLPYSRANRNIGSETPRVEALYIRAPEYYSLSCMSCFSLLGSNHNPGK